jgi:hypothetical protein
VVAVQRHFMLSAVPSSGTVNSVIRITGMRIPASIDPGDHVLRRAGFSAPPPLEREFRSATSCIA